MTPLDFWVAKGWLGIQGRCEALWPQAQRLKAEVANARANLTRGVSPLMGLYAG